ncbi:hypothetical protein FH968_00015 [Buttiauxella sp. B2]|uniref:hypothetical protein n=1 Tax=Buttiauxella sp. B2 TaxID=2587812 RepID=UPI00111FB540|nr:hypothetical protein [Buttiauxella sp. B2]TNV22487.1 hypothetical protein FH968_00015 [Buttiauxella sp. B2]
MALTDDELIAISDLPVGKNDNSNTQPDLITLHEVRGTTDSVFALPYQNTNIDVFGGGAAGQWALNFQNPLQRVVLDLEIYFGGRSVESTPPNLSALTLTLTGFSSGVIFAPATTYDAAAPDNYFGLTVTGLAPVIKLGGKRRRLEQSGQVIIPLVAVLLSENPLTTQEVAQGFRTLSVALKRTDESQTSVVPILGGMVYSNPLPSARDGALVRMS